MPIKNPILLLPGVLGTVNELKPLKELLEAKGHPVLSMDLAGHGKTTSWPAEFRIDYFARQIESFLQQHQLTDLVVFGHSLGGYVALYHQANFNNPAIHHIFTYGTKFNWSIPALARELPMLDPDHLLGNFPQMAQLLQEKHGEKWRQLLKSTAHLMQHLEKLDGLNREDMADIVIPVSLLLGDQDKTVTTEETQIAASWPAHASVQTISHSRHDAERTNFREIAEVMERLI